MPRSKSFNQSEVLEKAVQLFWRKGYSQTSIQDLVQHLGINRASLYDTYGDKKALFNTAFEKYANENQAYLKNYLKQFDDAKKGFKALFFDACARLSSQKNCTGCFVVNTITELAPDNTEFTLALQLHTEKVEKIFYKFLKKNWIGSKISKEELKAKAAFLIGFYNGLHVNAKLNSNKKYLESIANQALIVLN